MGRPRKEDPRCCQLNLSLTRVELETLKSRAYAAGLRLPDFGRARVLKETENARPSRAPPRIEQLFVAQLIRLGSNLNQIARQLNSMRTPAPPPSLEPLLQEIRSLLKREFRR